MFCLKVDQNVAEPAHGCGKLSSAVIKKRYYVFFTRALSFNQS